MFEMACTFRLLRGQQLQHYEGLLSTGTFAERLETPGIVVPVSHGTPEQLTAADIIAENHDKGFFWLMFLCTAVSIPAHTPRHLEFLPTRHPLQAKKTCYYNDTYTRKVHAVPCDGITGVPDAKAEWRTVVQLDGEADGAPDGLAIDCHGKLWLAHEQGGQVREWTLAGSHRSAYSSGVDRWNTYNISSTIPAVRLAVYMMNVFSHCCMQQGLRWCRLRCIAFPGHAVCDCACGCMLVCDSRERCHIGRRWECMTRTRVRRFIWWTCQ